MGYGHYLQDTLVDLVEPPEKVGGFSSLGHNGIIDLLLGHLLSPKRIQESTSYLRPVKLLASDSGLFNSDDAEDTTPLGFRQRAIGAPSSQHYFMALRSDTAESPVPVRYSRKIVTRSALRRSVNLVI
jgi:hypothetical protein